jgi:hypothetical protein
LAKLHEQLRQMQMQAEEAKAAVQKEREAARKAIEEAPPVVKETLIHVEDTAKVNSLTAEVEQLKVYICLGRMEEHKTLSILLFGYPRLIIIRFCSEKEIYWRN